MPESAKVVEVPMDYYDHNLFHLMKATIKERGLIGRSRIIYTSDLDLYSSR